MDLDIHPEPQRVFLQCTGIETPMFLFSVFECFVVCLLVGLGKEEIVFVEGLLTMVNGVTFGLVNVGCCCCHKTEAPAPLGFWIKLVFGLENS